MVAAKIGMIALVAVFVVVVRARKRDAKITKWGVRRWRKRKRRVFAAGRGTVDAWKVVVSVSESVFPAFPLPPRPTQTTTTTTTTTTHT